MYDSIPEELKRLPRWVGWRLKQKTKKDGTPDKPAKMPINPATGNGAMSNKASTWGTFQEAVEAIPRWGLSGIGFVFNGDGLVGFDIDHCRDPETGALTKEAQELVSTLDSYTEYSQSEEGLHIICRGKLPEDSGKKQGPYEAYETERYFIMTGNVLDDAHTDIEDRHEQFAAMCKKYLTPAKNQAKTVAKTRGNDSFLAQNVLEDDQVIERARAAKNGALFNALLAGNWKGQYASQSQADLALCNILAFYTACDTAQIDRIFRRSGLYRDKWDERHGKRTYGEMTIHEATSSTTQVYEPGRMLPGKKPPAAVEPPEVDMGYDQCFGEAVDNVRTPAWLEGPYNDIWNAQRFIDIKGNDLRHNHSTGKWHLWNGQYWQEDRTGRIRMTAADAILELGRYVPELIKKCGMDSKKPKELIAWIAKSRNTTKINNMLEEASHMQEVAIVSDDVDTNPWLLNVKNGTIELKTGKFRKHKREDNITKMAPVEYSPDARAPVWESFLHRIFEGNQNLIDFIQRAIGYSLTGSTKEQAVFVCYGSGANGKSTMINVLQDLLGDYARSTNFSTFTVRNDNNTNDIARLVNVRFVTAMEARENQTLNAALIKQLSGGDKISARFLHKEFFDFEPVFKIWMGANHKPRVPETDNGIWRRLKLIPFVVTIPPGERDGELPNKLKAELPGILSWALKGCLEWRRIGLKPPQEIEAATNEYRSDMDVLQVFLSECTQETQGAVIKFSDLYTVYCEWCKENGERQMSSNMFGRKLKERGIKENRTMHFKGREGIELSSEGKKFWRRRTENSEYEPYFGEDDLPIPLNQS